MNVFKKHIQTIIPLMLILSIAIYIFIDYTLQDNRWDNEQLTKNYIIGKIIKYEDLGRGGPPRFVYAYKFNDQEYKNHYLIVSKLQRLSNEDKTAFVGKRFYVKLIVDYPKYSELLLNKSVPDNIQEAPKEGWKSIPD